MPSIRNETIVVIGAGKVGLSIACKLSEQSRLEMLIDKNPGMIESLDSIPADIFSNSIEDIPKYADLIIIAINESHLEEIDTKLAHLGLSPNCIIAHTSGINDRMVLKECLYSGLKTASLHPYQTFFSSNSDLLKDIAWGIDCDKNDYEFLSKFVKSINGNPFLLDNSIPDFKALYHSSAVIASNYVTLLLAFADEVAQIAGIPAKEFLKPIVYQTIENFFDSSVKEIPLTGPIARGDMETIQKHISALKKYPKLLETYTYSSLTAAQTAFINGILSQENYNRIMLFLNEILDKNESYHR